MTSKKNSWLYILIIVLIGLGAFWYFNTSKNPVPSTQTSSSAPAIKGQVLIKQNTFMPDSMTVKVGDTVTWVNQESYAHNVIGDNGAFMSPKLATGEKYSFTFTKAGTFTYICSIHPFMHGTIIVSK